MSQNSDRSEVLLEIQQYFACGTIRPDRSDKTLKWEVRNLSLIVKRIIPHFRRYAMRSGKQRDFELFAEICCRMSRGEHLATDGLRQIVCLAEGMNPSGKRGHTPETILDSLGFEVKA